MKFRNGLIGSVLTAAFVAALTVPAAAIDGVALQNEKTGLCLDGDFQGNIYTKGCGSTNPYQHWMLHTGDWHGDVMIQSTKTGRCLAAKGSSVIGAVCNAQDRSQQWANTWVRDGVYAMVNESSGTALDSDYKGNAYVHEYGRDNPYQHWYRTS